MQSFQATVGLPTQVDLNYGEGRLEFEWADPLFGREGLRIEIDTEGFCSRLMPMRSGSGYPVVKELTRDRIVLRFPQSLAKKLELDEEIEILFSLTDEEFQQLQRAIQDMQDRA